MVASLGHGRIAQVFHLGMLFGDVGASIFARLTASVVGRRSQLVLYQSVQKHHLVTLWVERIILKFHRGAVEAHQVTRLAEEGGELVHDAALHAHIVMLRGLTNTSQLKLVDAKVE